MRRILLVTLAAVVWTQLSAVSASAQNGVDARGILLADGTAVTLELLSPMSSATARVDDEVLFKAAEDVVVEGAVVIRAGALAHGRVLLAQKRRSFGRRGKLDFTIDTVDAVDGQKVRLRYSREMRGKSRYGTAGVVTWLTGPFGVFVKGKNVQVPAGTEYTVFTDGERTIRQPAGSTGRSLQGGRR